MTANSDRPTPPTLPHEALSPCRRSCCWTPYGHSAAVNVYAPWHSKHCTCHQKGPSRG